MYEAYLDVDLCFQSFEKELENLPGKYSYPEGDLLIAGYKGKAAGCVAVRALDKNICEMKRLFVIPEAMGSGIGKKLAQEIILSAIELGYSLMRLDTLESLTQALYLYESLGFKKINPYYNNPLSGVVYLELDLKTL